MRPPTRRAARRRHGASLGFVLVLVVAIFGLLVAPAFAATPSDQGPVAARQAIPDGFTPLGAA